MKGTCTKILEAIISRLLFAAHGTAMVIELVVYTEDDFYWILLSGVFLLFIEMIMTLKLTKHGEWKWFSPMVFIYLCTIIPSVFLMELESLEYRQNITNLTNTECTENVYKKHATEVQCLEELIVLILIIGRWLMPRGKMSRDQLAQLLLMYLALGADILDILQLMKEPSVNTNKSITVVGLCLFTWAVMQFTIVLTQTLSTSSPDSYVDARFHSSSELKNCILSVCYTSEVWSVMITVLMQDGPFLIYRLCLVARGGVFNESMIFFISKNILTVIIQVYRVVMFLLEESRKRKKYERAHLNLE
ncbi:transmembrane protein 26-like [Dendropsophus ebraccatus]|uniref:transmembrane protein 26-like n=1 Tax=Dendropsophus ebraccatus TaxID=150705 RepID=UPI0038317CC5